ncbi:MAG: class I SAM-dependent methyltransferase [Bdellovibrionota bacterium]|nr:class I SAM-dependent methyltransferase [Bdellovibrionota bacterium]
MSQELFDQVYKKDKTEFIPPESLCDFYKTKVKLWVNGIQEKGPLSILELGCGRGTLFEKRSLSEEEERLLLITGIDYSFWAIEKAKSRWRRMRSGFPNLNVQFFMKNILDGPQLENNYHVVLDSHLYHCLLDKNEQLKALENVKKSLKKGGIFVLETMVSHKEMRFQDPFVYEKKTSLLLKEDCWGTLIALRSIPSPLDVEKSILEAGFSIEYFTIPPLLRIIPDGKRRDSLETDPQCLRIICRKT